MTRSPRRGALRLLGAVLAWVVAVLFARDARAESFDVADTSWEGCSELLEIARSELGEARVRPVAVLNWDEVMPEDGVLALHPMQGMDADETATFMKAGGRLAILDDYGRGDETLSRFKIERAGVPARPVSALRNRAALAIAEPVIDVVAGRPTTGPHPVVANVQRLVTNHPTGLRHPQLSPVLRIRAIGEPEAIIAVAGQVGKGRLFAMSDPSAVINMMLRYPGNRAFVAGLARYLVDDDPMVGRRQGRLFIVANRFREEGGFGGDSSLKKDVDSYLRAIASAIADARREGLPRWLDVTLGAIALLGVAVWVARSSAKTYKGPLPRYARGTPLVSQGGVAGRFGLIAAPSSPRSLLLMELKSALYESITLRLGLAAEPTPDALTKMVQRAGSLDDAATVALRQVLSTMQRVEASMVAGRPASVSKATLAHAAGVVHEVLAACGADASSLDKLQAIVPAGAEEPAHPPIPGEGAA